MKKQRLRFQYTSLILVLIYLLNLCVFCIPVQAEAISLQDSFAKEAFSDIAGHWAEKEVASWTARGLAGGYPDGTFRPDASITRAEFLALVNRAFGYTEVTVGSTGKGNSSATLANPVTFWDIAETDWYAAEVAKATAVGYIGGYPDGTMKPQNPITRQEVAAVLARILPSAVMSEDNTDGNGKEGTNNENSIKGFTDEAEIPEWSQAAIGKAVNGGYMNGYPDGTFRPGHDITRAEALAVLNRAAGTIYSRADTYGPIEGTTILEGNVTITTSGVTLQNTTITGNLYLTEGIGEGNVTLINITVQGRTKIAGGGRDSIHLRNTSVASALVNVPSRSLVRLLAQGSTMVGTLEARTPVRLEEEGLTGSGFTKVRICIAPPVANSSVTVELLGQFNEVEIQPAQSAQFVQPIQSVRPLINLSAQTVVESLIVNAPVTVQGQGTVETAQANVDGVEIEAQTKKVFLADGVQAKVAGKIITEDYQNDEPKKKSKDAALSNLTINGTTVAGFAPDTLSYEVVLPFGTTEVPEVAATAHHEKARVAVTQATALEAPDNVAIVMVTAENGRQQTYTVRLTVAIPVTDINLNKAVQFLKEGENETLEADIEPVEATNSDVIWESDNPGVATVDNDGQVTAVAQGTAKITATTVDGGKEASCWVKVVASDADIPVLDDSCVLYLDGSIGNDTASNIWYDLSGKGNHGTLQNFASAEGSGWTGQALRFDGEDDYVDCGNTESLNLNDSSYTFEAVAKHLVPSPYESTSYWVVGKVGWNMGLGLTGRLGGDSNNIRWGYQVRDTENALYAAISPYNNSSEYDEYVHLMGVYDKNESTISLYINGVLQSTEEVSSHRAYDVNTCIGSPGGDTYFFDGEIALIRIYKKALSEAEIVQNYFSTKALVPIEPVDGAVLDLRAAEEKINLDTGIWQDASGENNHATLHNVTFTGDDEDLPGLNFNGVNSYAEVATSINSDLTSDHSITLESFVTFKELDYENNNGKLFTMLRKGVPDKEEPHSGFALAYDNRNNSKSFYYTCFGNTAGGFFGGGNSFAVGDRELMNNRAYHLVVTINNSYATLFIDGEPVKCKQFNNLDLTTTDTLFIGRWGGLLAPMVIHHIRIYNRALTDLEVLKNYLACLKS